MFNKKQKQRLEEEKDALEDLCQQVHADLTTGQVALNGYPMPDGWNADRTHLGFDLPSTYPSEPPESYVPDSLQYRGRKPEFLLQPPNSPDGLYLLCIHKHDLTEHWWPPKHSMVTLARIINQAFHHPNQGFPWSHR